MLIKDLKEMKQRNTDTSIEAFIVKKFLACQEVKECKEGKTSY